MQDMEKVYLDIANTKTLDGNHKYYLMIIYCIAVVNLFQIVTRNCVR